MFVRADRTWLASLLHCIIELSQVPVVERCLCRNHLIERGIAREAH